jgi:pimeloyl-ACP methyl ester carboxylesterase
MTARATARSSPRPIEGARLVTLPACGHMMMVEQPDPTLDALIAFLAK